jgi:hypothetical protein
MLAIVKVVAVEVSCPKCKEPTAQPDSGSLMWEVSELRHGTELKCYSCGLEFLLHVPMRMRS